MKEKINFKELAKKSNVSIGTLSRFFNNGSISENKIKIIKKNIKKYNFVKNAAAAKVKKGNNELIILRTVIKSSTLDNIVSGIIENISNDVIVKYVGQTEKEVIKSIEKTISESPKYLIIFAPINASKNFDKIIKKASEYSKIIVYNYKSKNASSVLVSYKKVFEKIKKKYKVINFIYNDKKNISTFKKRIETIKKSGIKINISEKISKKNINFYQSQSLYRQISHKEKADSILISYLEPIKYSKNVEWIFVDQYFIGVKIAKLCKEKKIINYKIIAEYIENI